MRAKFGSLSQRILFFSYIWISFTTTAKASALFTVSDLGSTSILQQDATGTVHSVMSGDGSRSYAFEKSPTTSMNVRYISQGVISHMENLGQWNYQGLHVGGYVQYSLQNGSLTQGSWSEQISGTMSMPRVPLGFYIGASWHNEAMSPITDMNAKGQIVGTSQISRASFSDGPTYAAFSAPNGGTHDLTNISNSLIADNLNNYIDGSLRINLTQGLKVDDLGRIIARGLIDGQAHDFLLTPDGLPKTTPEPSTLVLLAVGIATIGVRYRRRW